MSGNQTVQPAPDDVQGNILSEYNADHATYLFYRVDLLELARQWLAGLVTKVTTEKKWADEKPQSMLNVAVTFQGFKALGVSPTSLNSFPEEFQQGMKRRAPVLCDFGNSDPQHWESPLGSPQVHVLVVIHGADRKACDAMAQWVQDQAKQVNGVTLLSKQSADGLKDNKEHFGFKDGISQPWIEGTNPGPPVEPDGGKRTKDGPKPLKLGEFLLGYKDELDRIPQIPTPDPLGRNGTYLVLRKISKDVAGFWKQMEEQATKVLGHAGTRERLAALMVGRWPSGCPVELSPETNNDEYAKPERVNAFTYDQDSSGERCPVGAHIRRTNLRDLKLDKQGNPVVEPVSTRHRMIRRGLHYGSEYTGDPRDKQDRGSIFIALVADIGRQFEFLQRHWINNGDPFRLDRSDRDPLIGNNRDERDIPPKDEKGQPQGPHKETPRKFTVPAATKIPWALNLPEFVTTRGGDYFFLPSLTALKGLAGLGFSSFLKEYNYLEGTIPDPAKRALAQTKRISDWLIYRPKEMLDELLGLANGEKGKIFQMPGYLVFGDPRYSIGPIMIVTKYDDVLEVLDGAKHPEFSVKLYRDKMEIAPPRPPRGPFILGMELWDPRYRPELKILGDAVQASPVSRDIPGTLKKILDPIFDKITNRSPNKLGVIQLDVIQDLAWPVPLGLNDKYFGVPGPDPVTFKRWLRDIYKELFLNLPSRPDWTKEADVAASEMNPYLDGLIQQTSQQFADDPTKVQDSVLKELIKVMKTPPPGLAPNFIRRNMMGLTVGVVETSLKAIARTIDQLLRRPQQLQEAQEAARGGAATVLKYALEAMRFNPQNHVLFRLCAQDTKIACRTPRETEIKKGTLVFAATLSAMFDEDGPFKQPAEFKLDRDPEEYLFFGYDAHECMGRFLSPVVLQEVLMRLLTLKNLQRANDDPFDPLDLLPEHFMLEFTP